MKGCERKSKEMKWNQKKNDRKWEETEGNERE